MNKNIKILIVEDEEPLRKVLVDLLSKEGYTVLETNNGKDAITIALTVRPDLMLLDIILPLVDGMTVLKKIQADETGKKMKVIMLTNLSDAKDVAASLALGSNDFLVKSDWKLEDVVKVIRDRLNT